MKWQRLDDDWQPSDEEIRIAREMWTQFVEEIKKLAHQRRSRNNGVVKKETNGKGQGADYPTAT